MSVINKMLQDLDKRGASPGGLEGTGRSPAASTRPKLGAQGREIVTWALVILIGIGAVWLTLWLWPESPDEVAKPREATQLAQMKPVPAVESPRAAGAPSEPKPMDAAPKPEPIPPKVEETISQKPVAASAAPAAPTAMAPDARAQLPSTAKAEPPPAPAARMAPEAPKAVEPAPAVKAPAKEPVAIAKASVVPIPEQPIAPASVAEPKFERRAPDRKDAIITISKRPAPAPVAIAGKPAAKPMAKPAEAKTPTPAPREPGEIPMKPAAASPGPLAAIAKPEPPTPQVTEKSSISIDRPEAPRTEPATREYRAALELMNQGRVELALGTFASVLRLDPKHFAARQTMVVLLLERGRIADAQAVLRDGLAALPSHVEWAMLLARIQVESGDAPGALGTLEQALPHAKDRPDYHAFAGTLLQMQGRHKDAIAHYEIAVRLAPNSGRWLTGLAISLEEDKRVAEAREAYGRALASRTLGRDLQAFVERKLGQLQ